MGFNSNNALSRNGGNMNPIICGPIVTRGMDYVRIDNAAINDVDMVVCE